MVLPLLYIFNSPNIIKKTSTTNLDYLLFIFGIKLKKVHIKHENKGILCYNLKRAPRLIIELEIKRANQKQIIA